MAVASSSLEEANARLRDHFDRDRGNDYDFVHVLIIYWKDSDSPHFEKEAHELEKLFGERFRYQVQRFEIPSVSSQLALDKEIATFLLQLTGPRSLGIIHYGGHGDGDDEDGPREQRSVWANSAMKDSVNDKTLRWWMIQPKLGEVAADVLLILDCCYAAQAARSRDRVIPPNVELLAACAMRLTTPMALDPRSFTGTIIRLITSRLDERLPVVIKDLHASLCHASARLVQTPFYYPLQQKNKSIRLDPCAINQAPQRDSHGSLTLKMLVETPVSAELLSELTEWLIADAPRMISRAEISQIKDLVIRVETLRDLTIDQNKPKNSLAHLLQSRATSQSEVGSAWNTFFAKMGSAARLLNPSNLLPGQVDHSSHPEVSKVKSFLQDFDDNLLALQQVIDRNILTLPELFHEKWLQPEILDSDGKHTDVVEALRVRLLCCMEDTPHATHIDRNEPFETHGASFAVERMANFGEVFIEYRPLGNVSLPYQSMIRERLERLAAVLEKADTRYFRTPKCHGCILHDWQDRFGLVFQLPPQPYNKPTSLRKILTDQAKSANRARLPSLDERFHMAYTIGRALLRWHLVGWVHQGIASYNIVLFTDGFGEPDYNNPYLCGFDYSREADGTSVGRDLESEHLSDLYRHPERQGCPPQKHHTRYHDIYSFGLLLVEIGLWSTIDGVFGSTLKRKGVSSIRDVTISKVSGKLSAQTGVRFEMAALSCLSSDFGIEEDDKQGSRLSKMFEDQVLRKLEDGVGLRMPS